MALTAGLRADDAAHVLVIPYGTHGHTIPLLRLARMLAREGVTVTFVVYEDDISGLTSSDSSSELQSLDFRVIGLDKPSLSEETTVSTRPTATRLREAFMAFLTKLIHDKNSGVAGPTSILSDMFLLWTQDVADQLQIPRYIFVPSGVIFAKLIQNFGDIFGHGQVLAGTNGQLAQFEGSLCIPGLPPLRYHELPRSSREDPAGFVMRSQSLWRSRGVLVNSFHELERKVIEAWTTPRGVLVNSFHDLEGKVIEAWTTPSDSGLDPDHAKVPKVYPVGPLFPTSIGLPDVTVVHGLEDSAEKSLLWLDSQPSSSVLYVAFGTHARLPPEQINELALGLEGCKQRFLWVIPQPKEGSDEETQSITDAYPPGFQARVGDRGCIVTGWVPQLQILAHSSTAAFLTHCGWNSSLESILMGVPMIAWPQSAEQHLNCRYVMDDLKVATQIQAGAENILDRKEVERAVRLVMVESEGKAMRCRVEELQRKGAGAVAQGGSQARFLQEFLDDIRSH